MKIKKKASKRIVLRIILAVVLTAAFFAALSANRFITGNAADYYSTNIFPVISVPVQSFSMLFQNSLTENIVIIGVPALLIGLIVWFVFLIKKFLSHGSVLYLYKSYRNLIVVALLAAIIFQAMHGINYRRTDVEDELALTDKELTFEDYCATLK